MSDLQAQTYTYKVIRSDKQIGTMTAIKRVSGDTVYYSLSSQTVFKMIFSIKVNYDLEETYVNGVLVSGNAHSTLNGTTQRKASVRKYPKHYAIEQVSTIYKIDRPEIRYSIPEIYFSEPEKSTRVFSQVFAEYLILEKIGTHKFLLYSEDGKNTYHYEDGICTFVEVSRPYSSFDLVLDRK